MSEVNQVEPVWGKLEAACLQEAKRSIHGGNWEERKLRKLTIYFEESKWIMSGENLVGRVLRKLSGAYVGEFEWSVSGGNLAEHKWRKLCGACLEETEWILFGGNYVEPTCRKLSGACLEESKESTHSGN